MFTKLAITFAALSMMGASAFAESSSGSTGALDRQGASKPIYAAEGMPTLQSNDSMSMAPTISTRGRDQLTKECMGSVSPQDSFCQSYNQINDLN